MGPIVAAVRCPVDPDKSTSIQSAGQATRPSGTDANHLFANNVRFVSMAAIIAAHTIDTCSGASTTWLLQALKFGTIGFFLVAGFLFGERIDDYSSLQYFSRRLRSVALPWTIWYGFYSSLSLTADFAHRRVTFHSADLVSRVYAEFSKGLLDTAYWFVPNLIIALAVLLVFRRRLRDYRMGLAFLLLSLFYAANIYGGWIPVKHTRAVFGFVFYLWLGAWGAWHFKAIEKWLSHIPMALMIALILVTNVLALGEARLLVSRHSEDALNTLRITNQLASIVVVLGIVKLKRAVWPRFVDVRAHTYGLYLTHMVALVLFRFVIVRALPHFISVDLVNSSRAIFVLLPLTFVAVYGGSLFIVKFMLSHKRLRWAVGVARSNRPADASRSRESHRSVLSSVRVGPRAKRELASLAESLTR
ncbi:MAG TPA: acyltransferase [Acidobacteriaceae bacterium]|nr:acyltransferase [Acidobacteriaceae bacterium]